LSYIKTNRDKYNDNENNIDTKDADENTALFYAVKNMHPEMVNLLLNIGADVNKRCELGNTPLH